MAIVKKYKTELIAIDNIGNNVFTLEFKSNSGKFKYLPGQFLHLALDEFDPSEGWPESRCFSIQTSPEQENIKITYSVKGAFTSRMSQELKIGKILDLKLPFGELFQNNHSKENTVFIAGGTGMTPFLSLFTDTSFKDYILPVLYFGYRDESQDVYNQDFAKAEAINSSLKIIKQNQENSGFLNIETIWNQNPTASCFFISGPQLMIKNFKAFLLSKGLNQHQIITDDWE